MRKLAALVASIVLAACGGATPSAVPSASPTAPAASASAAPVATPTPVAPVELTLLGENSPAEGKVFWENLITLFEAENPDIKIKLVLAPGADRDPYAQQLLAAGKFPDVAILLLPQLFKDSLMEWDPEDPDVQQINDATSGAIDGKLLHLGVWLDPWNLMFYNKDMFATAGITDVPTTRDEFDAALAKLKSAGFVPMLTAGEWVTGYQFIQITDVFNNYGHGGVPCWNALRNEGKVHFQDLNWQNAVDKYAEWVKNGYFNQGAIGLTFTELYPKFVAGEGAMFVFNSYGAALDKLTPAPFPVGVFPVPSAVGGIHILATKGGLGYTVAKATKYPEQAVRLAKWLAFDPVPLSAVLETQAQFPNVTLRSGPLDLKLSDLSQQILDIVVAADSVADGPGTSSACRIPAGAGEDFGPLSQALQLGQDGSAELKELDDLWDKALAAETPAP